MVSLYASSFCLFPLLLLLSHQQHRKNNYVDREGRVPESRIYTDIRSRGVVIQPQFLCDHLLGCAVSVTVTRLLLFLLRRRVKRRRSGAVRPWRWMQKPPTAMASSLQAGTSLMPHLLLHQVCPLLSVPANYCLVFISLQKHSKHPRAISL